MINITIEYKYKYHIVCKTSGYMYNNIHLVALHVLCAQWFILTFPVQADVE